MFNTICHQGKFINYDSNKILTHTHYFITLKPVIKQNVENNVKQWKLSYFAGVQNVTDLWKIFVVSIKLALHPPCDQAILLQC